jgi:pimeloyl-ACP methyl ester carboxylesterase
MALPALVLVHGASHAGDCWDFTVDKIRRRLPELTVLAVDLPGRRDKPGDLIRATIEDWADSVVADVNNAGLDEVVVAGHSMAGLTVPGVATKLGSSRVREMVFIAAYVPPEGTAFVDTIPGPLGVYARRISRRNLRKGVAAGLPAMWAAWTFCNGMTRAQRRFNLARLYPESPSVGLESVDRTGMPDDVVRTWILTMRDRTLPQKAQHSSISALGGVQTVIPIDSCHNVMISEPKQLGEILVDRCRLYAT